MKIVGNDISYAQGLVNFDVYKDNANFVIFKDDEGVGFQDAQFQRNHDESHRVGMLVGWYHFARPDLGNSAEAEADDFLTSLGELHEGEFLVLDFEVGFTNAVAWCKDFLDHIYLHTKIQCLIYLNKSQVKGFDWTPVAKAGYGLYEAAYDNQLIQGAWPFIVMQQWTNAQQVPGINGKVDGDYFFGTADQFKAYGYHKPIVVSPSASISPSSSDSPSKTPSHSPSNSLSASQSPSASASPSTAPVEPGNPVPPAPEPPIPTPTPPNQPKPGVFTMISQLIKKILKFLWSGNWS